MRTTPLPLPLQPWLGRSDVRVTELSFGAAAIGGLFAEVSEAARAAVDAAWAGGIRTFDTAPHYGLGLSERRLGDALRHRRRDDFISTKVGRLLRPAAPPYGRDTEGFAVPAAYSRVVDFSADGVRRSLDSSLSRLGLDRIDIALIHDPDDHGQQALQGLPGPGETPGRGSRPCHRSRHESGRHAGSLRRRDRHRRRADSGPLHPARSLRGGHAARQAALDRGVAVQAGGVFNSGVLAAPGPGATYDYRAAPDSTDRARPATQEAVCDRFGIPLRAAAAGSADSSRGHERAHRGTQRR